MKDFFREWKPKNIKDMDKADRAGIIYDYIPQIVEFYIKHGHNIKRQNDKKELFDRMADKKFAKALMKVVKDTEDFTEIDLGLAAVITGFIENRHSELEEDMIDTYTEIIDRILKKRVKELNKKLGLDKDLIKEMLVIVPEPSAISNPKFVGIYVHRILRKLYTLAAENDLGLESAKNIKKIFKAIFGKKMLNDIAINILLERKEFIKNYNESQNAVWNLMTTFALDQLEDNEKKEIRELLKNYIGRRKRDDERKRDSARRIQFSSLSEEDYPNIYSAYEKLADKEGSKYL